MIKKTKSEKVAEIIISYAAEAGRDTPVVFQDWLQWLIELFSLQRLVKANADYITIMNAAKSDHPIFAEALTLWVESASEHQGRHQCVDFFGEVYEECFLSKGKASRLGQYFTPYALSGLLSRCLGTTEDRQGTVYSNEPSCGSGRNLLALWQDADWSRRHVFYAEDLDPVSVKMCALNMMINGMFGYVVCHNTLLPDSFIFAYAVNEVRDPIPTDLFSIRQIGEQEFAQLNPWQPKPQQKISDYQQSLFDEHE